MQQCYSSSRDVDDDNDKTKNSDLLPVMADLDAGMADCVSLSLLVSPRSFFSHKTLWLASPASRYPIAGVSVRLACRSVQKFSQRFPV